MHKKILTRSDAIEYSKDGVLDIPEDYGRLCGDFAYFVVRKDLPRIHTLIIPKTVEWIDSMRGDPSVGPYGYRNNPFERIIVSEDNEYYTSVDGVLFSKDMKKLISYPCGKKDEEYHIPEGVEIIEEEAFLNVEHLRRIWFPESLRTIERRAFSACIELDFPDIIKIYAADEKIIFVLPKILSDEYDENPSYGYEKCFYYDEELDFYEPDEMEQVGYYQCIDDDVIEIDPVLGEELCAGGALIIEGNERREALVHLRKVFEIIQWRSKENSCIAELQRFQKVFFSEHL